MASERFMETLVGIFMLAGIVALLMLSLKVSGISDFIIGRQGYMITAQFDNIGNLSVRAPVKVAGVTVGRVEEINLDSKTDKAVVKMWVVADNKLPTDTSAGIFTEGLLGINYVGLSPGYDNDFLKDGSQISNTHSALILEDLIGQLLFKAKS